MNKKLHYLLLFLSFFSIGTLFSQTTEDFEDEAVASSSFTDNGQIFNISSSSADVYRVLSFAGGGWNGTAPDNQFIDNTGGINASNDGSNLNIKTNDGTEFIVPELYIFCSQTNLSNHSGTLSITGWKGGVLQFTIAKSTGFSNTQTFSPFNGFTYIDFVTEGAADYSQTPIDELVFTSAGNLDYMALDAFTWDFASVLSTTSFDELSNKVVVYPNPSSKYLQFSNINTDTAYAIYTILGKRILTGNINQDEKINISTFNTGIYLLKLEGGRTIKFIKK